MAASLRSNDNELLSSFIQNIADDSCKKQLTGIAIGVIVNGQELSAVSGWADVESRRPVSASTVFEIGSISKLFTSLLLAVATTKKEVGIDDPVQTALGEHVTLPTDGKSQITYRSLANHRSSLPRLPDDLITTADMENPYAHYDQEMLYACLNRMKSVKPIGLRTTYSNLGVGLLGHVLGKLAKSDYRTALNERVLSPLEMHHTTTESSDKLTTELATPHKSKDKPTKHWDFTEVTVAAGGVRSSLSDMFKFLRANVYLNESGMADELAMMRQPSNLPKCRSSRQWWNLLSVPILYVAVLAVFKIYMSGWAWLTQIGPAGFSSFLLMLLPTVGASYGWGRIPGAVTLCLMTLLTWWLWRDYIADEDRLGRYLAIVNTSVFFIWGVIVAGLYPGSNRFVELLRGDGRLAWQGSKLGAHPMLWHNGMVGGSASFLGIVPDLEIGVVVLTNTARPVGAIGVKILREMKKVRVK